MSGHNKWSKIKRQKGAADNARGKIFTKLGREIAVAVKAGGADPVSNSRLRDAIAKAKSANMPNDNVTRSIKKASGELGNINYENITYEGYAAGGVAVIVEVLTDNKNRAAGEVRHIFDKCGGEMGVTGCVSYLFESKGLLSVEKTSEMDDDEMMMLALECGAEDFEVSEDGYEITTSPADFSQVREALENKGVEFVSGGVEKIPATYIEVDEDTEKKILKMLDMFDDNDDVQDVYHNAELSDE